MPYPGRTAASGRARSRDVTGVPAAQGLRMSVARRLLSLRRALLSLCVLAILAFTLYSIRLSDASFTAKSTNPANVMVAGALSHSNNYDGKALISVTGMRPGDSTDGTMTIIGGGNLTGDYTLSAASLTETAALSDTLQLTVVDNTTGDTLYDDDVSGFDSAEMGTIAPGASRSYTLTLAYPGGPDYADLEGASMTLTLQVSGESQ